MRYSQSGEGFTKNEYFADVNYGWTLEGENACEGGYFHMFRPTNLRFFNNLAVVVATEDERVESLKVRFVLNSLVYSLFTSLFTF